MIHFITSSPFYNEAHGLELGYVVYCYAGFAVLLRGAPAAYHFGLLA